MLVSMNSTLVQFLPRPADRAARSAVRRVLDSLEKAPLGFCSPLVPLHQFADRLGHNAGHRLVSRCRVDPEPAKQRLGKAQGDVAMSFHAFQCIMYSRDRFARRRMDGVLFFSRDGSEI